MPAWVKNVMPLLCMAILGAVFLNAVYYQLTAIPQFVFVLQEWGFESLEVRRRVARGVIFFELICVLCIAIAVGTGITNSKRFGFIGWRLGRGAMVALLLYLQLLNVLYAVWDPLFCGCGPLPERIDGWIEEIRELARLPIPRLRSAVPIARNALLSLFAVIALQRGKVKKPHE